MDAEFAQSSFKSFGARGAGEVEQRARFLRRDEIGEIAAVALG